MAEYLSPGVYVEEFDSGGKSMEGVGTSTAGFVGAAQRGQVGGVPQLVTSFADFKRKYGGYLPENVFGEKRFLSYAVEHFFMNGGSRCFISRVCPADAKAAEGMIPAEAPVLKVTAKNPGAWGNDLKVRVTPAAKAKTQILSVTETETGRVYRVKKSAGFQVGDITVLTNGSETAYNRIVKIRDNNIEFETPYDDSAVDDSLVPTKILSTCEFNLEVQYDDTTEIYENASFNISASNYIEKMTARSDIIRVEKVSADRSEIVSPFAEMAGTESVATISMRNGSDGTSDNLTASEYIGTDNGAGNRTGIQAFLDNSVVSIMAVPGITDPNVQMTLIAHCEDLGSRFAILDMPKNCNKIDDITNFRNVYDSQYAAIYHPWLEVNDPLDKKNTFIPPSGSVAGVYARSDNTGGVHKAPANEVVRGCVGLSTPYNKGEQDILNPIGVNLIRAFPGQGIRVWGARTLSGDSSWKYVNVRRLFIYIEETIKANTNWVVFEPNTPELWNRVRNTIEGFLLTLWSEGALAGDSASEAFFCEIGASTMTKDDIDNGRLICVIGVAPVKPAEFVIFRITQKTSES